MESCKHFDFLRLVREPIQILSTNGRLMVFITIPYLFLNSLIFLMNTFSTQPFISDLLLKVIEIISTSPGSPEYVPLLLSIGKDVGAFLGIQLVFLLIYFFVSILNKTVTIIISAFSCRGKNLSLRDLVLIAARSWTRPLITSFYVTLLSLGYTSFFMLPFAILSLMLFNHVHALIAILVVLAVPFIVFNLYLSVAWILGIVVSVIEDSKGTVAIGEATELVKGNMLQGFLLNFLLNLVVLAPSVMNFKQSLSPIIIGLINICFTCLVNMFQSIAYTILYFHCKKKQENGSVEYNELPSIQVFHEDV